MPVHSRGDKKETNHHDEMEVDYAENEGSSSEDEDTESSSVSEDGDSSVPAPGARQAALRTPGGCVLLGERGGDRGKGRRLAPGPGLHPDRSRGAAWLLTAGLGLPSSGTRCGPAPGGALGRPAPAENFLQQTH
ncbi:hypothetical protein P7K49_017962 [Saguinus oedipus]|uniref:Uncharacterized protein n=1 Tax=Saguinus oedipus TaxID=9490 RepID=A0ABQ9V4Q5_SAGOE|nr:hypothetical protein P7K49_017962 [Saguinus oedipus]